MPLQRVTKRVTEFPVTQSQTYRLKQAFEGDKANGYQAYPDYDVTIDWSDTLDHFKWRMRDNMGNSTDWTGYYQAPLFLSGPHGVVMMLTAYFEDDITKGLCEMPILLKCGHRVATAGLPSPKLSLRPKRNKRGKQ